MFCRKGRKHIMYSKRRLGWVVSGGPGPLDLGESKICAQRHAHDHRVPHLQRRWGTQSRKRLDWVGGLCIVLACSAARAADIGTAFTYQGFLEKGSPPAPVTDTCNFRFGLWNAAAGGNQQGASPQTVNGVSVRSEE